MRFGMSDPISHQQYDRRGGKVLFDFSRLDAQRSSSVEFHDRRLLSGRSLPLLAKGLAD